MCLQRTLLDKSQTADAATVQRECLLDVSFAGLQQASDALQHSHAAQEVQMQVRDCATAGTPSSWPLQQQFAHQAAYEHESLSAGYDENRKQQAETSMAGAQEHLKQDDGVANQQLLQQSYPSLTLLYLSILRSMNAAKRKVGISQFEIALGQEFAAVEEAQAAQEAQEKACLA